MQQTIKSPINQHTVQPIMPKKKAENKTVQPYIPKQDNTDANAGVGAPLIPERINRDASQTPDYNPNTNSSSRRIEAGNYGTGTANFDNEVDMPGFGMPTGTTPTSSTGGQVNNGESSPLTGGLLGQSQSSQSTESQYQSDGYSGVQGETNYQYTPSSESLVQNQITGLLDPNSDLMRKAIAQANGYSASRGLQSSSIGSEVALSSMIDKALPIAQQDANTYANADQTGWNNSYNAEQNNLTRSHDAYMFDKQGKLQTDLQNLQHEQSLSTLDRQAELQKERDELLNQFDLFKMDKTYLQELEKTQLAYERDDAVFERNLNGQMAMDYRNAVSDAYNKYLEQVALVFSNPNMTAEQQNAGAEYLKTMFESQRAQLQIVYGVTNPPRLDAIMDSVPESGGILPGGTGVGSNNVGNASSGGGGGGPITIGGQVRMSQK